MLPVADAIGTAHDQGVIHRDLKPENIFLVRTGYTGLHPKILDFGISKVLGGGSEARALTGTAATMGTMNYLPPEQLHAAREADERSDQYALGTILYECVTGTRAFEEATIYVILKKIAEGEFVRPSTRRRDLPPRMEEIILRAMSLEPAARFQSVRHLGLALLEFASDGARLLWTASFSGAARTVTDPRSSHAARPTELASRSGQNHRAASDSRPESGGNDGPRVATLLAPSSLSGGTIDLPLPQNSASTTLRSATGERGRRRGISLTRWSGIALVVGVIALAAGLGALALLRGGRTTTPTIDPNPAATDDTANPVKAISAAAAPSPTPRQVSPQSLPPASTPTRGAIDERPPSASAMGADPGDPSVGSTSAATDPPRKGANVGPPRANNRKEANPPRQKRAAPAPASPAKPLNDAVIID
jgi:eukaryotic-like serine/threonine-protein kinase